MEAVDRHAFLLHRVAETDRDGVIAHRVVIDRDAVGRPDGILTAVTLTDGVLLVVLAAEVEAQHVEDLFGLLGQPIFANKGQNGQLNGRQRGGELQYDAGVAPFEGLFGVCPGQYAEEQAVDTDRGFDHIGRVARPQLCIEILYLLAGELLVLRKVEIGAAVNPFHFLESERHLVLDVRSCIGIVSQLFVVVEAILFVAKAEVAVPAHARFFPTGKPGELFAWPNKELHLHLLKLPHPKNELPRDDLIPESLSDLSNAEGDLHASRFLDIEEVDKDSLRRFGAEVNFHGAIGCRSHFGGKHEVELAYVRPVARAR